MNATAPMKRIRVLIVDDSALVRKLLTELLGSAPDIEVVGAAPDAFTARDKIKALNPDVLTLDVEMPKMDGVTFLRNLMRLRPMPVVMVSTLTEKGADVTLDALSVGAVDYLAKPKVDLAATLGDYRDELLEKIRTAACARVRAYEHRPEPSANQLNPTKSLSADAVLQRAAPLKFRTTDRLIAVGASTGGTEAIKDFLLGMPPDAPGIVITQHIPKAFSGPFAERMNRTCPMTVYEAQDGQQILPGHAYIAPGDKHLIVQRSGARWICRLDEGPAVNRHKPAVDVLFRSVAQSAGHNAIGVLLTGMGRDGALGMKEIQETGAPTIAQDEATSVVWGMPGEAVALGAADEVLPLPRIAQRVMELANRREASAAAI
jgi:two-component system, chemotaxis family, protein-glutamate methylesterase/glutaminase